MLYNIYKRKAYRKHSEPLRDVTLTDRATGPVDLLGAYVDEVGKVRDIVTDELQMHVFEQRFDKGVLTQI